MGGRDNEQAPAHRRLSHALREQIAAGHFDGGRQLPTELELAETYVVSRQTVRRAFYDLVADGLVYRVPGRGTFVSELGSRRLRRLGAIEELTNLPAGTTTEIVAPLRRRADIEAASRLRLDDDFVSTIAYVRRYAGIVFAMTTVHLPDPHAQHLRGGAGTEPGAIGAHTIIGLLEPHLSTPVVELVQSITVAPASEETAHNLDCPAGHPLLRADRVYLDSDSRAVELAISFYLPEHFTYRNTIGRS
ncbi:GntR family transcriptional regulator [Rhodococcus sp. IEGM 248]|uniref:GntR family transcriptional regulator n=1 Tax=Rhodococcus opacus TaxID=37919 RepID=UPI0013C14FB6|nr:GntR family transcriptional regulator [Rhodococcus opacus]MDV7089551.1 GntR family transcriptional regulator [Rhodococcus opacus]NDV10061.1 GntR family transcriptional regulator [Rhodococcus sp. IEGM 248]